MTETNPEQTVADFERVFEDAKVARNKANLDFDKAKARYRMKLVARKKAGEKLTIPDIDAMEILAIDDVPEVKEAYLAAVKADSHYRDSKIKFEDAKRGYWDGREEKRHTTYRIDDRAGRRYLDED